MQDDLFLGRWRLIPELCLYESGDVPLAGLYTIHELSPGLLHLSIEWTAADGTPQQTEFSGPADGSRQSLDGPGVTAFSMTRVGPAVLDSAAFSDEDEVMYARRSVSADGQLLSTVQAARSGDGSIRNFQVYRREDE